MNTPQTVTSRASVPSGKGVKVEKSIMVGLPPARVYAFWRRLENLPRFMHHLAWVEQKDATHSHWAVKAPRNKVVHWDAEIIEDRPNELISWRSLPGADVDNAGSVWFTPAQGGRSTVVKVALKYAPPAGKLGVLVAKFLGRDAETEMDEDLLRLKQLLEGGEFAAAA